MTLHSILVAAALALSGGAYAATPKTPPGTAANPHPDSPTSLLREAKQGSDADAKGNSGPVANGPVTSGTAAAAPSPPDVKPAKKKGKKRRVSKPAA
jgi:hypothetical protein